MQQCKKVNTGCDKKNYHLLLDTWLGKLMQPGTYISGPIIEYLDSMTEVKFKGLTVYKCQRS